MRSKGTVLTTSRDALLDRARELFKPCAKCHGITCRERFYCWGCAHRVCGLERKDPNRCSLGVEREPCSLPIHHLGRHTPGPIIDWCSQHAREMGHSLSTCLCRYCATFRGDSVTLVLKDDHELLRPNLGEQLADLSKEVSDAGRVASSARKLFEFCCRLDLRDHPIAEQREFLALVRELRASLDPRAGERRGEGGGAS